MGKENKYLNKLILIGINFFDKEENIIEQYQTHGIIKSFTDSNMMKIERSDLSIFILPFDKKSMKKAKKGTYKEHESGIDIENPDFLTTWSVNSTSPEHLENIKLYGFSEFE